MPVSIVVGGQFGSEGKGKVALELARASKEDNVTLVRVGGPNSGHTGYDVKGQRFALRQLPAGCIDRDVDVVFPAGSYLDVDVLFREIEELDYPKDRIFISRYARVIMPEHKAWETEAGIGKAIGSTGSGVGAAVMASVARDAENFPLKSYDAEHVSQLDRFVCDTSTFLRKQLLANTRVIIEGSQGFGLSLLEGGYWPKATSRSTTASAALSEAGLSPLDVDDIYLVLRSFPIRVAGQSSGPLPNETSWAKIADNVGRNDDISEYTTVTNKLRRVAEFDCEQVRAAIAVNNPSKIVMNHLDYVGSASDLDQSCSRVSRFVAEIETGLKCKIDFLGFSPFEMMTRPTSAVAS
jgi:adenylosuccinate synthase